MELVALSFIDAVLNVPLLKTEPGLFEEDDEELDAVHALAGSREAFLALINCDWGEEREMR